MPARAPASIDMLHTVIRPSIDRDSMTAPPVLDDRADAAAGADAADDAEDHVLGPRPGRQLAVDGDRHGAGPGLRQGLRGQDVLDLAGADTERQRTEGAVCGGVAVAADHGAARQREAQFGADHVHDALAVVAHGVQRHTEVGAVVPQHLQLAARHQVGHRSADVGGGHVVVLGGHREVGAAHRAPGHAQPVEGLRGGDLVDEVQVDEQQVGAVVAGVDDVGVPDLLAESSRRRGHHVVSVSEAATATTVTSTGPAGAS